MNKAIYMKNLLHNVRGFFAYRKHKVKGKHLLFFVKEP